MAKNRVHIDISVAGKAAMQPTDRDQLIRAKATELVALGATVVRQSRDQDLLDGVTMHDHEGNESCVA